MEIFAIIGIIVVAAVILGNIEKFNLFSKETLDENKLIKKFNSIIKSARKRNIDDVKEDLLEVLDKYKICKTQQFQHTNAAIEKSLSSVNTQIRDVANTICNLKYKIKDIKNNSEPDVNKGAQFIYQLERFTEILNKLQEREIILKEKKINFLNIVDFFNSEYALKRSEISIMIADSTEFDSGCNIDIKLDSLINEFKDKVNEQKAYKEVSDKITNTNPEPTILFNKDAYIEKFNNFNE